MRELFFKTVKKAPTERELLKDEILATLEEIRAAEKRFSFTEDPDLIDSAIFELNSLNSRFNGLLKKAKLLDAALAVSAETAAQPAPAAYEPPAIPELENGAAAAG